MSFGLIRVSWIDTGTKGSEENKYIAETREIRQTNVIVTILLDGGILQITGRSWIWLRIWNKGCYP